MEHAHACATRRGSTRISEATYKYGLQSAITIPLLVYLVTSSLRVPLQKHLEDRLSPHIASHPSYTILHSTSAFILGLVG